jgi:hypothetical protein
MALEVKLAAVPQRTSGEAWVREARWWNGRKLSQDPRVREVELDAGYLDWIGILTPAEAWELQKQFRVNAHVHEAPQVDGLDELLKQADADKCLIAVTIFEWESGM